MTPGFGRDALRRMREKQQEAIEEVEHPTKKTHAWIDVPPDAPMDDATITVWNGERFVAWDKWLATAPILREDKPETTGLVIPADATCVVGECGGARVWLVKDGERWLMYVGSRKANGRRRDFATPYVEHAIRTAEQWYGAAGGGWRAEKGRDGTAAEAADLYPQDSTLEKGTGNGGHDDLNLDGLEPGR